MTKLFKIIYKQTFKHKSFIMQTSSTSSKMQFLISGPITLCLLVLPILATPIQNATLETYDDSTPCEVLEQEANLMNTPNGVVDPARRWPNNIVYYKISDEFDAAHRQQIRTAMNQIEQVSCVRFVLAPAGRQAYVHIIPNSGAACASNVGYYGQYQILKLAMNPIGVGCFKYGIIIHELLHTCGFKHQHQVWNRDNFIIVRYENINEGGEQSFAKLSQGETTDYGVGYDVESIMHYGPYAQSKNGLKTIEAYDQTKRMGQRDAMTASDIAKLNYMYNCY